MENRHGRQARASPEIRSSTQRLSTRETQRRCGKFSATWSPEPRRACSRHLRTMRCGRW